MDWPLEYFDRTGKLLVHFRHSLRQRLVRSKLKLPVRLMPLSIAEVLWTARYDYQPDWKLASHSHEHFQMIYCLGGSGRFSLEDREYPLDPGSLFLIKPRRTHGLIPSALVKTLDLKFVVRERALRRSLMRASEVITDQEAGFTALFEHIRTEGERKDPLHRELCSVYLLQILIRYLRRVGRLSTSEAADVDVPIDPPLDNLARQALEFIQANYAADLSLNQVAHAVGHSDRRVRQRFEESLGTSPMRYLKQYRVRKAMELIQYADHALKDVAGLVGFKSIHHFTRVFHEITGATPAAWRRKYPAGICKDVVIDPRFSNTNRTIAGPTPAAVRRIS
jgi:AraC-like DNA-binding protein/mannose-6-phosphate isomerase-like protein (cupin superfamily)